MSTNGFVAIRLVARYRHIANAPPEEVFPLLCPVREAEWIEGWSAKVIFSDSGLAEDNCIFTTNLAGRGETTYVVTRYDKEQFAIEFVVFNPGMLVGKLDITVTKSAAGKSELCWTRTYTGLSPEGNSWAEAYVNGPFQQRMSGLAESMNSYLSKQAQGIR
jgi:hypothetical protein